MKSNLNIFVLFQKEVFLKCNYMELELEAATIYRTITFKNVYFKKEIDLPLHDSSNLISIRVYWKNKGLSMSKMKLANYSLFEGDEWVVSGELRGSYDQGCIDVLNLWQQDKNLDWFSLPLKDYRKNGYINACMAFLYGFDKQAIERGIYEFDMSLVKEELDFVYMAATAFLGYGRYLGWNFYTLDDCMRNLRQQNPWLQTKKMLFTNVSKLQNEELKKLYREFKKILGFSIQEQP